MSLNRMVGNSAFSVSTNDPVNVAVLLLKVTPINNNFSSYSA